MVAETAAYLIQTEDGPAGTWDYFVFLTAPRSGESREMVHGHRFRRGNRLGAEQLAEKVLAAGSIDPDLWIEADEPESLEDKFARYAEEEMIERMGGIA
jgi:hypothetical protein